MWACLGTNSLAQMDTTITRTGVYGPGEKQVPRFSKVAGIGNLPGTHFVYLWRSSARLKQFHQWQLSMAPAAAYYCGVDMVSCEGIKSTKTGRLCAAPLAVQKRYCTANAEGRSG